jgi:uncharacterized membrane protein YbhN (UPF0104 family)
MSSSSHHPLLKSIHPSKIIFPVIIGMGVVAFIFFKDFNVKDISILQFSFYSVLFLLLAFVFMALRDIGYMIRIRILSDNHLNWRQAFRVIMLWEFTSAVTPSAVGGTSIAVLFVTKEGISVGRSTAIVLTTSFLDELYFVLIFPIILLLVDFGKLFSLSGSAENINLMSVAGQLVLFALIGYGLKLVYLLAVGYGLFVNPRGLKWLLLKIFTIPGLRRWRVGAAKAGDDIVAGSLELKSKPFKFWVKAFLATFLSWTSRYWVVNAIFMAFFVVPDHFLIFARQLVMWIMMLVSPTPGGSGFAEFVFTKYLGELMPVSATAAASIGIALALIWRLISYYPYLLIGGIILPGWIKSKFIKKD